MRIFGPSLCGESFFTRPKTREKELLISCLSLSPLSSSLFFSLLFSLLSHWFSMAIKVFGNRLIEGVGLYSSGTMCDKQSIPLPSTNIVQQPRKKKETPVEWSYCIFSLQKILLDLPAQHV
jgi:hypothetical protein